MIDFFLKKNYGIDKIFYKNTVVVLMFKQQPDNNFTTITTKTTANTITNTTKNIFGIFFVVL